MKSFTEFKFYFLSFTVRKYLNMKNEINAFIKYPIWYLNLNVNEHNKSLICWHLMSRTQRYVNNDSKRQCNSSVL